MLKADPRDETEPHLSDLFGVGNSHRSALSDGWLRFSPVHLREIELPTSAAQPTERERIPQGEGP